MNSREIIGYILLAIGLILIQVLFIDQLDLSTYIKPQVLVLFPLLIPIKLNRAYGLLTVFAVGLICDFLLNTHGIHAFCMTLVFYLRNLWLPTEDRPREDFNIVPGLKIKLNPKWLTYLTLLTLTYHLVFFSLEFFSLYYAFRILITAIISTLFALLFQWLIYLLLLRKKSS